MNNKIIAAIILVFGLSFAGYRYWDYTEGQMKLKADIMGLSVGTLVTLHDNELRGRITKVRSLDDFTVKYVTAVGEILTVDVRRSDFDILRR